LQIVLPVLFFGKLDLARFSLPTRRSSDLADRLAEGAVVGDPAAAGEGGIGLGAEGEEAVAHRLPGRARLREVGEELVALVGAHQDRKSTRLNSSHVKISYAVFCLKK